MKELNPERSPSSEQELLSPSQVYDIIINTDFKSLSSRKEWRDTVNLNIGAARWLKDEANKNQILTELCQNDRSQYRNLRREAIKKLRQFDELRQKNPWLGRGERVSKLQSKTGEKSEQKSPQSTVESTLIETKPEKITNVLNEIKTELSAQPQSIKDNFEELEKLFYAYAEYKGMRMLFTKIQKNKVLAWVQEDDKSGIWKTRMFRFSGSDHQWKSLPGMRHGDHYYLKGDEANPSHHYVQSAKLDKGFYSIIESLPNGEPTVKLRGKYLPMVPDKNGENGRYWDEFEFKEEYQTLKNPEWKEFQEYCQNFYKGYSYLSSLLSTRDYSPGSSLYKFIELSSSHPEMQEIKNFIDETAQNPDRVNMLKNFAIGTVLSRSPIDSYERKLADICKTNIGKVIEKSFSRAFPEGMIPDFSVEKCIDSYDKKTSESEAIHIEEYQVSSSEGDQLVIAMARDSQGKVYIDNIYDPRVKPSSYGVMEEIINMGHLVYKPEDYYKNAYIVPDEYKKPADGNYMDISALWGRLPIIQEYKKELAKREVV